MISFIIQMYKYITSIFKVYISYPGFYEIDLNFDSTLDSKQSYWFINSTIYLEKYKDTYCAPHILQAFHKKTDKNVCINANMFA